MTDNNDTYSGPVTPDQWADWCRANDTNHPLTSDQVRQYAAMAIEAADEFDRLGTP
jgi:hypothetical protein